MIAAIVYNSSIGKKFENFLIEKELFDKISNNNEILFGRVIQSIQFKKNNNVLPVVTSTLGSTAAIVGCCTNVPSIISSQVFANQLAFQSFVNSGIKLFNGVLKTNISQITMWTTKATQLASNISTFSTIFGFATLGISEIIGVVQKRNEQKQLQKTLQMLENEIRKQIQFFQSFCDACDKLRHLIITKENILELQKEVLIKWKG